MKDELQAREKLIEATTELIRQYGNIEDVTIRDITARAGVGVGLVNYHFQTKENLVNQCIQRIISQVISQFDPLYKSLEMEPMNKLRFLVKENFNFLINNPGLSRASITTDMLSDNTHDNTMQTTNAYRPVLQEVCGDRATEQEIGILLHVLISSIQVAFLRKSVLKETMRIDFMDKKQRDEFVDKTIDHVLARYME